MKPKEDHKAKYRIDRYELTVWDHNTVFIHGDNLVFSYLGQSKQMHMSGLQCGFRGESPEYDALEKKLSQVAQTLLEIFKENDLAIKAYEANGKAEDSGTTNQFECD